jgi:parvulin-like peptidyl-prolyl isomerase
MKKITVSLILGSQLIFAQNLAKVNGDIITDEDLLPTIVQITQGRYGSLDSATKKRVQDLALEQVIAQVLISHEAEKNGILRDPEVQRQLDVSIRNLKRSILSDLWLKQELDKQQISTIEIRNYYNLHKNEFVQPAQAHARHILVDDEASAKYLIKKLSKLYGEDLKNKFIEFAKQYSKGPSGKNGGDLGYFTQGQMVPEFDSAVFNMGVGTITKYPVKTKFGYHIIYLEDKQEAKTLSFQEAKEYIQQKLKVEKFKTFVDSKVRELKSKANIIKY